jgi:hypothetical protein
MTMKLPRTYPPYLLGLILTLLINLVILPELNLNFYEKSRPDIRELSITIQPNSDDLFTVYYDLGKPDGPWIAQDSINQPVVKAQGLQTLRFKLPDSQIFGVRLDLGNIPGAKRIQKLTYRSSFDHICVWQADEFQSIFSLTAPAIGDVIVQDGFITYFAFDTDPYIYSQNLSIESICNRRFATQGAGQFILAAVSLLIFSLLSFIFGALSGRNISLLRFGIAVVFITILALPLLGIIFNLGGQGKNTENRTLADLPTLTWDLTSIQSFPAAYNQYFSDHFGWRSALINWTNQYKVQVLKSSPVPSVLIGKSGWLYYTGDESIDDYQGLIPFTNQDLKIIQNQIRKTTQRFNRQGITFLIVIAPNKQTIYPEFLPDQIRKIYPKTRLDQVSKAIPRNDPRYPFLDLRSRMSSEKQKQLIYYRTDTHWNNLGAYFAYQEIMNRLAIAYPAVKPYALSEYDLQSRTVRGFGLATIISLDQRLTDQEFDLNPKFKPQAVDAPVSYKTAVPAIANQTGNSLLPKAVIFRDSFATTLKPYLSEHFQNIVYVSSPVIDDDIIQREKPAIVILELVERKIGALTLLK